MARHLAAVLLILVFGCSLETETTTDKNRPVNSPRLEERTDTAQADVTLQVAMEEYERSKSKYISSVENSDSKQNYVSATVRFATASMMNREYPKALELYDEALQLDPDNEEANTNKQMILSIYEQLQKDPPAGEG